MIIITGQTLELLTSSTAATDYVVCYVDYAADGTTITPAISNGQITTAVTTTILTAPSGTVQREIQSIFIRNVNSTSNDISVKFDFSGTDRVVYKTTLSAGQSLAWSKQSGWLSYESTGIKEVAISSAGTILLNNIATGRRPPEDILKLGGTMEAAGVHHSFFYTQGRPGGAAVPSPGLAGAALTTYAGQIPFTNPASGNTYLANAEFSASQVGMLRILDRLWHNSGIVVTTTTSQTINSVAFPARDNNGATSGEGVMIAIEVSTATTNGSPISNTTMTYTNQSGTGSRTATIPSFPATAVAGTFVPFALQAGDTGVQSIQSITLGTSYGGGAIHLVAYRALQNIPLIIANTGVAINPLTGDNARCFDNTVGFLVWMASSATAANITGSVTFSQPG